MTSFDLNTVDGFVAFLKKESGSHFLTDLFTGKPKVGDYHCSKCGDSRRHRVSLSSFNRLLGNVNYATDVWAQVCPAVFDYVCTQCDSTSQAFIRYPNKSLKLSVHPSDHGGLRTPKTPDSVAYYLDEAMRSEQAGARSAAAAMYRSALEMLLLDQGFTKGMLNDKILALVAAVAGNTAPPWAYDLDTDFLDLLKQIGNGSIHTNGGDISKQAAIDDELLRSIGFVMKGLLGLVYELPVKKLSLKGQLQIASAVLKK